MAGEEEEDYMGDVSQFLPPEIPQSSSKQVKFSIFVHDVQSLYAFSVLEYLIPLNPNFFKKFRVADP